MCTLTCTTTHTYTHTHTHTHTRTHQVDGGAADKNSKERRRIEKLQEVKEEAKSKPRRTGSTVLPLVRN